MLFFGIGLSLSASGEESGLPEFTEKELESYNFEIEDRNLKVKDISLGQRYVLSTQRREFKDLVARRLGILELKGDKSDLETLQALVDRKVLSDVREWQSLGIVFGDILTNEFGLHWVSYEDDLGTSKALRWRKTENYVFPVTLFSKRVQFREKVNISAVYEKLETDIRRFREYENRKPVFK